MNSVVKGILADSAASTVDLAVGDRILAVNGNTVLEDLFDYQFAVMDESGVTLTRQRGDAEPEDIYLEKDPDDDPGLVFESPVFTPIKTCNNACPFCFIDQQPDGLRPSLYIKDDDWRLSYFCNTYITLTNLTKRDRERIEMLRPGPLYVSVHSTQPDIRARLLVNPKAAEIMTELKWLQSLDIPFHAQLVICPGINDGESFSQTLADLLTLRPACESIAVVPLGLTEHRVKLPMLSPVTKACAEDILDRLAAFNAANDSADFAFASDEFYSHAQRPLPSYEAYGDFPQLDDGVGTARLLSESFYQLANDFPDKISPRRTVMLITGELGGMLLNPIALRFNQVEGLFVDVLAIKSEFWGESITVSGLITGADILSALKNQDMSSYDEILIPDTMIREEFGDEQNLFLDGVSVAALSEALNCPIQVVSEPSQAASLVNAVFGTRHKATFRVE